MQTDKPNQFTQGELPASPAVIMEWLKIDQVAMSLLQGYLAACKSGLIRSQSQKNALFSGLQLNIKDDYG